jgi:hypothetical protein
MYTPIAVVKYEITNTDSNSPRKKIEPASIAIVKKTIFLILSRLYSLINSSLEKFLLFLNLE